MKKQNNRFYVKKSKSFVSYPLKLEIRRVLTISVSRFCPASFHFFPTPPLPHLLYVTPFLSVEPQDEIRLLIGLEGRRDDNVFPSGELEPLWVLSQVDELFRSGSGLVVEEVVLLHRLVAGDFFFQLKWVKFNESITTSQGLLKSKTTGKTLSSPYLEKIR